MMGLHLIHAADRQGARRALQRPEMHGSPCQSPVTNAGVAASERRNPDHACDYR